jgi:hypothetical protein
MSEQGLICDWHDNAIASAGGRAVAAFKGRHIGQRPSFRRACATALGYDGRGLSAEPWNSGSTAPPQARWSI